MGKVIKPVKRKSKKIIEEQGVIQDRFLFWSITIPFILVFVTGIIFWRANLSESLKKIIFGQERTTPHSVTEHARRNLRLMREHTTYIYGIDVSQYQGQINWIDLNTIHDEIPLDFVFIRATMGEKAVDTRFGENWEAAQSRAKLRGAYHYFRPNENSVRQAQNFIGSVQLRSGDLPPVIDIEERPKKQSMDSLKVGLRRWLELVESHYGIKPIVYSGDSYFTDFLQKEFSDYILWIANYNFWVEKPKKHWNFWQFSERGFVRGIKGPVDLNLFKGDMERLEELAIPY
ncbi:MAG: GH25 family lysozyme [Sphingobacterium sp.]|uniref:GH25 family lysozyme n=1 Tax=Sphingobacterium sp. JB170 TaxID=1434842 RepID=UPI00097E9898|nr:GH25 family lysozyme [Sphingobacterium sp. JB170]SJN38698.1 glycoside hydrolase, family 25 [Sphingobacterium sp. JB170]